LQEANPKDIIGSTKVPIELWPELASAYGSLGLADGEGKYGRGNYRATPVRCSIYVAATRRHLAKFMAGEDIDQDSGLPHLGHILACIAIIVEALHAGTLIDDRNYNDGFVEGLEQLTEYVSIIKERHKDKTPKHYTIQDHDPH